MYSKLKGLTKVFFTLSIIISFIYLPNTVFGVNSSENSVNNCNSEKLIQIWNRFEKTKNVDEAYRYLNREELKRICEENYNYQALYFYFRSLTTANQEDADYYEYLARTSFYNITDKTLKEKLKPYLSYCRRVSSVRNRRNISMHYKSVGKDNTIACYIGMKLNPKGSDRLGELVINFFYPINSDEPNKNTKNKAELEEFLTNLASQIRRSGVMVALKKSTVDINQKKLVIKVYGYASSTGNHKYNLGLSKRRAQKVADMLKKKLDFALKELPEHIRKKLIKIETKAFGETRIRCKDRSEPQIINGESKCPNGLSNEDRDYNRRVDVVLSIE